MIRMALPFASNQIRAYEIEFGAGGQRLGCNFMRDDETFLFIGESEITTEIESLMGSLGSPTNSQLSINCCCMLKQQVRQAVPKPQERTHRTTGINLPTETWELLRRVAFERSRRSGGRGSVSALLVQLVERHKRELERELASASR
jgi:hypothetical protein